jgi:hypothetical protein
LIAEKIGIRKENYCLIRLLIKLSIDFWNSNMFWILKKKIQLLYIKERPIDGKRAILKEKLLGCSRSIKF